MGNNTTIGLKRGEVRLSPHHKGWSKEFEREKARILKKIGDSVVDIQHIGSTSVPGLNAKPIIDMSAGVYRFKDAKKLVKALRELGYGFDRTFQHQLFFAKGSDKKRTHYLHIMRYEGTKWGNDRLFRDYLIKHPQRVKAYANLKAKLARMYPNERQKYSDGKDRFIKQHLRLANL